MRIFKVLILLVVLLCVVAGVFVWTMPAELAWRWGGHRFAPVVLSGVRGSVWDGHADGVSVFGRDLGELSWTIAKGPLLRGRVAADIRIKGADVEAAGLVTRLPDRSIDLRDVRFRFAAQLAAPALDIPALNLLGTFNGVLNQARIAEGRLQGANGAGRWSDAGVSGHAEARFSDILVDFSSKPDGGIGGVVRDDGQGNLAVEGMFDVGSDRFGAEARLAARNDDVRVQEALRYVGQAQPDGSSHLVVQGRLFPLL
ncbi:type II secretion system protein N [Dokdonella koreensis]|uniref:Type II secretion system protein N n=1 Tax=Dokdonella koreensis DS-123 TaxID=1300342 RepID=A0A160DRN7_9GAMM|nr:type II secretion system protein N [Dokdonella koreensis]ANB16859.1 General secretion pathway protein GspN [Dokdonella koreensis DS-123]